MFKKFAAFALLLAVVGLYAVVSVEAQRMVRGSLVKSTPSNDTLVEPIPEANPSFDPAQCANGGVGSPVQSCGVSGSTNWDTGNMNGSKAHYAEGTSIHYRYVFANLVVGTQYKIRIAYDAWEGTSDLVVGGSSTAHTIDYLNTYNAGIDPAPGKVYTVNPCGGVSGTHCSGIVLPVTFDIPDDPTLTAAIEPAPGVRKFTAWGVSAGTASAIFETPANPNAGERVIEITFTPFVANPVLAWSGHIAKTTEWQAVFPEDTGAGGEQGSPYHMRNAGNGTFNGQRELQLAANAVQIVPSAAGATVSGRVTDAYGRAISSAKMTITNALTGETVVRYTNTFGYYTFTDLPVGDFFVMSAQHRRYLFVNGSVSFTLEDSITGMNFQASR